MRIALIDDFEPAVIEGSNAITIAALLPRIMALPGPLRLTTIIENWDEVSLLLSGTLPAARPLSEVRLRAPLPRPAKLLCGQLSFREGVAGAVVAPAFFLKSSSSVIGPGDTVTLPCVDAKVFHHEAELAIIIGRRAKDVSPAEAMDHVFGYTCFMDMSARGVGPGTGYQDKSYDTFGPMGPWIVTADEIADPHALQVRMWDDNQPRHDYSMSDIGNPVPDLIAYASSIAALEPGDVLAMGVNHQGLGPIQDGETVRIEIAPIGGFEVHISDPLRRRWEKQIDHRLADAVLRMVRHEPLGIVEFARRIDGPEPDLWN